MILDEAIRQARLTLDRHMRDTVVPMRAEIASALLQYAEAGRAGRTVANEPETLSRDVLVTPTLRDQFAMRCPYKTVQDFAALSAADGTWAERSIRARYVYADMMLAARSAK